MEQEKAKQAVKRNLWGWGFRCRDMTAYVGGAYDLHVEAEGRAFRVKVVVGDRIPPEGFSEAGCPYDACAVVVGRSRARRFYSLGKVEQGETKFYEWSATPTGVFRESRRKEAQPSP